MKDYNTIQAGWKGVISALVVVLCILTVSAQCETDGTALLLQQTPLEGGTITPAVGVHNFAPNTEVTLTAVPKPGYQFVYWMGDVSDPASNSTIAYLDVPKIIIAVFERAEYEFFVKEGATCAPGQRLMHSARDYGRGGYTGGGAKRPKKWSWPKYDEEETDFPTPEDGDDFPVPEVPEPATMVLLALGSLLAFTRGRVSR